MRNVTISLPGEVYRRARIKAAEQNTSVSALVREFLMSLGDEAGDFARRKKLQDSLLRSIKRFRAGDRLDRDQVHVRGRGRKLALR